VHHAAGGGESHDAESLDRLAVESRRTKARRLVMPARRAVQRGA
jgi:hypothetical protein